MAVAQQQRQRVDLVRVLVGVGVALAAAEEMNYLRQRAQRARAGWWRRVQHREQSRLTRDELVYLLRRLGSR